MPLAAINADEYACVSVCRFIFIQLRLPAEICTRASIIIIKDMGMESAREDLRANSDRSSGGHTYGSIAEAGGLRNVWDLNIGEGTIGGKIRAWPRASSGVASLPAGPAGWPTACRALNRVFHSLPLSDPESPRKSALSRRAGSSRSKQ